MTNTALARILVQNHRSLLVADGEWWRWEGSSATYTAHRLGGCARTQRGWWAQPDVVRIKGADDLPRTTQLCVSCAVTQLASST